MTSVPKSKCFDCRHLFWGTLACQAFPVGIPAEIIISEVNHFEPIMGQRNDLVFTSIAKDEGDVTSNVETLPCPQLE
jgi:hypothetical protein